MEASGINGFPLVIYGVYLCEMTRKIEKTTISLVYTSITSSDFYKHAPCRRETSNQCRHNIVFNGGPAFKLLWLSV